MQPKIVRLHPFALPSETTARLTLLIVAAVALAIDLGLMLTSRLMAELLAQIVAIGEINPGDIIKYRLLQQQNIRVIRQGLPAITFLSV